MGFALRKEDDDSIEFEENEFNSENFIEMEVIDESSSEAIFRAVDNGVYITSDESYDKEKLFEELNNFLGSKILAESLVSFLGSNSGKFVDSLLGYKPTVIGGEGGLSVSLRVGKLHIPEIEDFVLSLSVDQSKSSKCDLRFKIFGVNGGASKEYKCKISQKEKINGQPVDLVIPVNLTVIEWRHDSGRCFHSYEIHSFSKQIKTKVAENDFQGDAGYDKLKALKGNIEPFDTKHHSESLSFSEEIEEKTKFKLGAKITSGKGLPSVNITGELNIENKIKIMCLLPTNYLYVQYADDSDELQRIWAYKKAINLIIRK